ncbi:MAG TPA: DUF433 domain-containing protein [Ignavibacteria bacterium]|nr:DUF433 domain-containing protein [Ignavibacteria bacterium]
MNLISRIESNPGIMLGKPVIKGTRITVELILTKLASGFSNDEIIKSYDHLTNEDILAAIEYAASVISKEEIIET